MTFYVQAPIFVFREFMRHRVASYNEESGRYRELNPVFYVPGRGAQPGPGGKPGAYDFLPGTQKQQALVMRGPRGVRGRVRLVPADAGCRRRARGRAHRVAADDLLVDVRDHERALADELPVAAHARARARFPSFPQREIEMVAEKMESFWEALMPLTAAAFNENGRVAP